MKGEKMEVKIWTEAIMGPKYTHKPSTTLSKFKTVFPKNSSGEKIKTGAM